MDAAPDRLVLRRLRLDLRLPPGGGGDGAQPGPVALERAARRDLPGLLARGGLPAGGDAVVLIRRIDLDLSVPAGLAAGAILDRLGQALLAGVAAAMAPGVAAAPLVMRFPTRAHHAAAFLAALVRGEAFDRWWFRGFAGLRALPLAAAIRTALLRDPAAIPAVLAAIAPPDRLRLLEALGAREAAAVLRALPPPPGPAAAPDPAAWEALAEAALGPLARLGEAGATLALLATLQAAGDGDPATSLALLPILRALAALAPSLADPRCGPAHRAALEGGPFARLPAPLREAILRRLDAPEVARVQECQLRLGGLLMLLPALLALELDPRGWPAPPAEADAAALLRLLVLAACAGPRAAPAVLAEPGWGALLGLPRRLDRAPLADWAAAAGPARWRALTAPMGPPTMDPPPMEGLGLPPGWIRGRHARRALLGLASGLLRGFARRLPGFAAASAPFLRANLLAVPARLRLGLEEVAASLARPPLDVLLGITGVASFACALPDGRRLVLERAPR